MKKNKMIFRFFALCMALAMFVSAASASGLPTNETEVLPSAGDAEIQVNAYQLYITKASTMYSEPGGGLRIGGVQEGDLVCDEAVDGSVFAYADGVLWRHIFVQVGIMSGISGWVPNDIVSSYSVR